MATKIVHCKKSKYDILIDRTTIWGNPYIIGEDGSREEVIKKFKSYILNNNFLLSKIDLLRNKTLGCWCFPKECHGDILVYLIELMERNGYFD